MKQTFTPALPLAAFLLTALASPARPAAPAPAADAVQQAWVANDNYVFYDSPLGLKVATDAAGNSYTLSQITYVKGTSVCITSKFSPDGKLVWRNSYSSGYPNGSTARDLAVDPAGNVYIATTSSDPRTYQNQYATVKYSTAGYQQWVSLYAVPGSNNVRAIALDASGNVYVTGNSADDYATVKYNNAGQQQWASRYDSGGSDTSTDVAVDAAGNVYVTGTTGNIYGSGAAGSNFATLKYNSAGQQQWVSIYDGGGAEVAVALGLSATGSVAVTGSSTSSSGYVLNDPTSDYVTVQYSASGQQQWANRYNGPGNGADTPADLAVDASGNVVVTGSSLGSSTSLDYATLSYSASGQQRWLARFDNGSNGYDTAYALTLDAAGNAYVTGQGRFSDYNTEFATLKYDLDGQQQWVVRYRDATNPESNFYTSTARDIALDAQNNVFVVGSATSVGGQDNVALVKYIQQTTTPPPTTCDIFANQPRVPGITRSIAQGSSLTVSASDLLSGATDPLGRPLTVASFGKPSVGSIKQNSDGTFTYTPWAGYRGEVKLTYLVQETGPVLASSATRHYYEFVDTPGICWDAAKAAAAARTYRGMQGYLATITYQDEEDFLKGRNTGHYFFGASDAAVEGDWRWTTGPEAGTLIWKGKADGYGLAYTNWQAGQPDDYKNQYRPQGEDYSLFYTQSGYWTDVDGCGTAANVAGYLVEYGGLEACRPILFSLVTLTVQVGTATPSRPAATAGPLAQTTLDAYPNPSNGQFRVRLVAAQDGPAQLTLFDVQGRLVRSLYSGSLAAGEAQELDVSGAGLATGLYQLRLQSAEGARYLRLSVQQ